MNITMKNLYYYYLIILLSSVCCTNPPPPIPSSASPFILSKKYTSSYKNIFNECKNSVKFFNGKLLHFNFADGIICFSVPIDKSITNRLSILYVNVLIQKNNNDKNSEVFLFSFSSPFEEGVLEENEITDYKMFSRRKFYNLLNNKLKH